MRGLGQIDLLEFQGESRRGFHLAGCVLCLRLKLDGRGILHDALHRHLNELIETVQLLPHQALLVEVGVDHDPAGLLPQLVGDFLGILLLVQLCKKVFGIYYSNQSKAK